MADDPDWSLWRSFLAVVQEGSLSAAARRLGLTQPTLGRHVEALEARLGLALFTRSGAGLGPTKAALALEPHARAMAAAAETLARTAAGEVDAEAGTLRVTASQAMGAEALPPILADFRRAWPRIAIELSLSDDPEDLLRRDADVAVRTFRPTQGALLARHIGAVRIGLYARRDYLERAGTPQRLEDLFAHTMIGPDRRPILAAATQGLATPFDREFFSLRTDSDAAALAALRAGFGIAGCQAPIAARDPDLVPVLPEAFGFELDLWVVMHEDLRTDRRAKALFDALASGLSEYLKSG